MKDDEMGASYSTHREIRNECKILVGKPHDKRTCRRPRHRWEHTVKVVNELSGSNRLGIGFNCGLL
jgi:hypothetical protein